MSMIVKENYTITPMVTDHWKNKFEKSIRVLLKSGFSADDLIKRIIDVSELNNELIHNSHENSKINRQEA